MIYSNLEFIILFLFTWLPYVVIRDFRSRFFILTLSSIIFYFWAGVISLIIFLSVILFSWLMTWIAHRLPRYKKTALTFGILGMVGNLFFWKYSPWLISEVQKVFPTFLGGNKFSLPLPIGISFFTLQAIAYLIDFYSDSVKFIPFRKYVLFKSFFPQLVAGPIVRVPQLLPQLEKLPTPQLSEVAYGLSLFCLGFFKKLVLADRCAPFVNIVFSDPTRFSRPMLALAVLGYAVQVWADFSGYTDMGRGVARMLGIRLPENFLSPYFSRTPSEFWNHWHMTLGKWIHDYVYLPLALSLGRKIGVYGVTLVTMVICGLWHGANWTFIVVGFYFGLQLVIEALLKRSKLNRIYKKFLPKRIQACVLVGTTLTSFLMAWIVFRSPDIKTAIEFFQGLILGRGQTNTASFSSNVYVGVFFCALLHALFYYDLKKEKWVILDYGRSIFSQIGGWLGKYGSWIPNAFGFVCGIALAGVFVLSVFLRFTGQSNAFIYFQF